jgi:hypothetical protein
MSEIALIPTIIPDQFRTSASGCNLSAVTVHIVIGSLSSVAKVCCQERYTNQVELSLRIINRARNLMNMRLSCIIYQL